MPNNKICERIDTNTAAQMIGCHPQYLREQMRKKKWDLGQVVYPKDSKGQCTYLIFKAKLDRFLGKEVPE